MVNNLRISVSFRSTLKSNYSVDSALPYIVMAYDSSVDKFSKVLHLFPHLYPDGCTPEGLAFEATLDLIEERNINAKKYFVNFSDGSPFFEYNDGMGTSFDYVNNIAVNHTRNQVNIIRNKGYNILSYLISDDECPYEEKSTIMNDFKKMYGVDACIIDVNNIISLSKTLNQLFLKNN